MTTEPTREEIEAQVARIETCLAVALNMVNGDGLPPDWDYLRLVRSQLPGFVAALTSRPAPAAETGERADAAMHAIWKEWFEFYNKHFRGTGLHISAADQRAFYEIAQPIMRDLASGQRPSLQKLCVSPTGCHCVTAAVDRDCKWWR